MFGQIFKKSISQAEILNGFKDFHSHILPGVDDGIRSIADSLNVLNCYEICGVQCVVLSPHIMEDYPENNPDFLRSRFELLTQAYKGPIKLILAAEYMLDSGFENHLSKGNMLTISDDTILVETSFMSKPLLFNDMIKNIQTSGYHIALAHPERYEYMKYQDYEMLNNQGVKFQLNLFSLIGAYGNVVEKRARRLLTKGLYHFIGTDIHSIASFDKMINVKKLSDKDIVLIKNIIKS